MNTHKNAALTPKGQAHLLAQIACIGLMPAVEPAGMSALALRASGSVAWPQNARLAAPRRSEPGRIDRAMALRRTRRLSCAQTAEGVGLSGSTAARACLRAGVACLPLSQDAAPVC